MGVCVWSQLWVLNVDERLLCVCVCVWSQMYVSCCEVLMRGCCVCVCGLSCGCCQVWQLCCG